MIPITPVRTHRINATLHELSLGSSIYLCKLPSDQHERGTGELLQRIVQEEPKPLPGQVTSPKLWTVQERAFVVAHYLAHIVESGPDFAIGDGRFSHYVASGQDSCPAEIEVGDAAGESWLLRPLLGGFAESIERLIVTGELPSEREGWLVGALAAQMRTTQDKFSLEAALDAAVDEYIAERVREFMELPASEAMDVMHLFLSQAAKLDHLLQMSIGDDGFVFLPVSKEVPGLPPARFHFSFAVSEEAQAIFGSVDGGGTGHDALPEAADGLHEEDVAV